LVGKERDLLTIGGPEVLSDDPPCYQRTAEIHDLTAEAVRDEELVASVRVLVGDERDLGNEAGNADRDVRKARKISRFVADAEGEVVGRAGRESGDGDPLKGS